MSKQLHLSFKRLALIFSLFLGSVTTMLGSSVSITVDGLNYIFYYSGSGDNAQGDSAIVSNNYGYSGAANIRSSVSYQYKYNKTGADGESHTVTRNLTADVTSIKDGAFVNHYDIPSLRKGSLELTSVNIPNTVKSIGQFAFCDCSNISSVSIPNSVTSIGAYAFAADSCITSIHIPTGLKTISIGAFYLCKSLTSVTIPDSVTTINREAFYGCTNMTSVNIPNSVTTIGGSAFMSCTSLTNINIPNSVTTIGGYAFMSCI